MPGFELIGKQEADAIAQLFEEGGILFAHGFDSIRKKYHVKEFESASSKKFNSKYCIALASGTAALKCALKAVGIRPGDEVITQSFNFIATIEAIVDCGAKPVICDIDENLHLNVNNLMERITKKGIYIGSIRHKTRINKEDKHKYDGLHNRFVIPKKYFEDRNYIIIDNKYRNERYDAYKIN